MSEAARLRAMLGTVGTVNCDRCGAQSSAFIPAPGWRTWRVYASGPVAGWHCVTCAPVMASAQRLASNTAAGYFGTAMRIFGATMLAPSMVAHARRALGRMS